MKSIISTNYLSNYRRTLLLAYPVVLSQLGHIMVGVVDTAMVGQIGTEPQAAVALSNSLYTLVLVFGLGVSYGVTPLVAAADSTKHYAENANLLKHGIVINTILLTWPGLARSMGNRQFQIRIFSQQCFNQACFTRT